jgi:hypothetical protein
MKTAVKNVSSESYVVEIDGRIESVYRIFVEALKAGMELKQKFPKSQIKVHDVAGLWAVSDRFLSINQSQEKRASQKEIDEAYKSTLKKIPDAKQSVDPWGGMRTAPQK